MERFERRRPRQRGRWRRATLALAFVATLPLGCRGIVGLDDFRKVECPGAICSEPFDGSAPADDAAVDASLDARADAPPGAAPVSWARWKMPNYGDSGLPNPPSLSPVVGGVVDAITGLVWQQAPLDPLTQTNAESTCRAQPGGPWRLPKRIELVSLLDYGPAPDGGRRKVFIDSVAFPSVKNVRVWSSSEVRPFTGGSEQAYWVVNFETGAAETLPQSSEARALCVKDK